MKIKIGNKECLFVMKGTIGHIYRVQSTLGDVPVDLSNPQHWMLFLYSVLTSSNRDDVAVMPTLDEFLDHLTGPLLRDLNAYVNEKWKELEPEIAKKEEKEGDEKNA